MKCEESSSIRVVDLKIFVAIANQHVDILKNANWTIAANSTADLANRSLLECTQMAIEHFQSKFKDKNIPVIIQDAEGTKKTYAIITGGFVQANPNVLEYFEMKLAPKDPAAIKDKKPQSVPCDCMSTLDSMSVRIPDGYPPQPIKPSYPPLKPSCPPQMPRSRTPEPCSFG